MKRIIDIDKLQEAQQRQKKQKSNYWQRIKNDPVKFGHYKEWRKQYVNKKKEMSISSRQIIFGRFSSRTSNILDVEFEPSK